MINWIKKYAFNKHLTEHTHVVQSISIIIQKSLLEEVILTYYNLPYLIEAYYI